MTWIRGANLVQFSWNTEITLSQMSVGAGWPCLWVLAYCTIDKKNESLVFPPPPRTRLTIEIENNRPVYDHPPLHTCLRIVDATAS